MAEPTESTASADTTRESNSFRDRYYSLLENTSEAVFCYEYDPPISTDLPIDQQVAALYEGTLAECNDVAARSYGAEKARDVIGRTLMSVFGEPTPGIDLLFQRFVEGGYRMIDGESSQVLPDGSTRYFLNNGHADIVEGRLRRVWGTYRDVTDQKRVEHALRESEGRFSTAFHTNPDPMIITSHEDTLLAVNDAFLRVTGFARDEVLFRNADELGLWADDPEYSTIKRLLHEGKPVRGFDTRLRTKKGETRFVNVTASRLDVDEDGFLIVARDVTNLKRAEEALQKSEEIFAKVFRSSPHLVSVTTMKEGIFIDVNEAFERVSGYKRSEIVGRTAIEMKVWASEPERLAFVERMRETGRVRDLEIQWRIKSGEVRIGQVSAEIIQLGGEQCIVSIVQDVTDRKKAEEAKRKSEERFAKAFHGSPHLVAITSLESGELLDVNEGFERMSGFSRSEAVGRRTLDLDLWDGADRRAEFVRELKTHGRVREMEVSLNNRTGETKTALLSAELIEIEGEPCAITIIQDITERKKTEVALKNYTQRLRTLREIDSAILASDSVEEIVARATKPLFDLPGCIHVGCYIRDLDGRHLRRVGGHSRHEYSPEYMDIGAHESVLDPVLNGESRLVNDAGAILARQSPASQELIDRVRIGSFFMVPLTVKGQHIGALGVVFDEPDAYDDDQVELAREIANPVAVAIERMRLQDELRLTNARLTTLSRQLVNAQEAERRYLANELHDHIGQMLTAAKLSLQQARDSTDNRSSTDALDHHIDIVGDALEQIRSLSLDLRPSLLDDFGLVPALEWLIESFDTEIDVTLVADPDMPRLRDNVEVNCFRVAQESMTNALRHADARRITVSLKRQPDRVSLTVADDGKGFDVDAAYARAAAGHSLGLLSMGERVRLIGGTLSLQSSPGEGTIVAIELPVLTTTHTRG